MTFIRLLFKIRQLVVLAHYKIVFRNKIKIQHISFRAGFKVFIEKNGQLIIDSAFFNNYCSITVHEKVEIGKNVLFGENVKIYDQNHIFNQSNEPISKQGYSTGTINIGNNVWVGSNCTILKGVTIGDNCIIGANCLVYKDIPDNSIVKCNQSISIKKRNI